MYPISDAVESNRLPSVASSTGLRGRRRSTAWDAVIASSVFSGCLGGGSTTYGYIVSVLSLELYRLVLILLPWARTSPDDVGHWKAEAHTLMAGIAALSSHTLPMSTATDLRDLSADILAIALQAMSLDDGGAYFVVDSNVSGET